MGASCEPSEANQSWSAQLAARRGRNGVAVWEGVQSLPDTFHFGITSHNRVIISSLSLSAALPLSLEGIMGCMETRMGGGGRQQPPSGVNRTHMHTVHTSSFRSIKEKEITRAEKGNLKIDSQSLIKATLVIWAITFFWWFLKESLSY